MPNALDLAVDPQLVHQLPERFHAGVGHNCAQIHRLVAAIRFHSIQDEPGVFAQGMHGDSRKRNTVGAAASRARQMPARPKPGRCSSVDMTVLTESWPEEPNESFLRGS